MAVATLLNRGYQREIRTVDTLIEPPTIEPIDLDETKKHVRFTPTSEDTLIDTYISAARQYFEQETGRQLIAATWERQLDAFPDGVIELPKPPLLEVLSVKHVDGDGAEQTLVEDTDYVVQAPSGPYARRGIVRLVSGGSWPATQTVEGAVRVRFRAGYGLQPGDVPELAKGLLFYLTDQFHQRGFVSELPLGAASILSAFKYSAYSTTVPMRSSTWLG